MNPKPLLINIDLAAKLHEDTKVAAYYLYLNDKVKKDSDYYYFLALANIRYGLAIKLPKKMMRGYSSGLSIQGIIPEE